jgi:hypothetical protein
VPCGSGNTVGGACTLCSLIVGIYNLIQWGRNILLTLTIVAIFISGIMYIISSGTALTEQAKKFLSASLIGFSLVLTAWLLIATVMWIFSANLGLATGKSIDWTTGSINFSCGVQGAAGTAQTPGGAAPQAAGNLTDANARAKLSAAGISVVSSGNCSDPSNSKCTSLEGIPSRAIDDITNVKNQCGAPVTVTGGTETGHQSHGAGIPTVDLQWNNALANCVKTNASSLNIKQICTTPGDSQYRVNCNYNEGVEHLHVAFT